MSQPCKVPCSGCPFARATHPGELGGSHPFVYIGQASGPFMLPCHHTPGYTSGPAATFEQAHCIGAAIFRANIGVAERLPKPLLRLPPNTTTVFATNEEFLAHHAQCSAKNAESYLKMVPPHVLTARQMQRSTNAIKLTPR